MNNVDHYSFVLVSASACRTDYFVEWGFSILCMQRRSDLRSARISSGKERNQIGVTSHTGTNPGECH